MVDPLPEASVGECGDAVRSTPRSNWVVVPINPKTRSGEALGLYQRKYTAHAAKQSMVSDGSSAWRC